MAIATDRGLPALMSGMTLRDYFATAAIQGLAERPIGDQACSYVAQTAYKLADAMLKERDR